MKVIDNGTVTNPKGYKGTGLHIGLVTVPLSITFILFSPYNTAGANISPVFSSKPNIIFIF